MDNLHIIKASAGSGKTYTLARLYLEQLLFYRDKDNGSMTLRTDEGYHQHILAITFTNKATNEMKSRIVKELYILSQNPGKSDFYKSDFKKYCPDADKMSKAASKALASILFDYSTFQVKTIDAFFQSVLRNFARELDRDYNYEVQIDGNYAAHVATHNFLLSLGKDSNRTGTGTSPVEQWVKEYLRAQYADGKNWNDIFDSSDGTLAKFARKLNSEFVREHLPALRQYLTNTKGKGDLTKINAFKRLLIALAEGYKTKFEDSNKWKTDFAAIAKTNNLTLKNFYKGRALYTLHETGQLKPNPLHTLCGGPKDSLFNKPYPDDAVRKDIKEFAIKMCKTYDMWKLFENMARKLSFVGLLGEIDNKLEEYRHDTNSILIADTNDLIGQIVDKNNETPFIYERTGTWINTYMLDEFQDTSNKQYLNFKPLIKDSLDNNNFNLIIGDTKQAIYRFRNADPSLLRETLENEPEFAQHVRKNNLDTNWRSLSTIVHFNNAFTGQMIGKWPQCVQLQMTYTPDLIKANRTTGKTSGEMTGQRQEYEQKVAPPYQNKQTGMVRMLTTDFNGNDLNGIDAVCNCIPQYLLTLSNSDDNDTNKPFDWKDIIILVNKKKEGRSIVEAILNHNKEMHATGQLDKVIPVVSGEMMTLSNSSAVKRIISLLRFIDITSYITDADIEDQEIDDSDTQNRKNLNRMKAQRQFQVFNKFIGMVGNKQLSDEEAGQMLKECFEQVKQVSKVNAEEQMKEYSVTLNSLLPDINTEEMSLTNIVEHLIAKHVCKDEGKDELIYLNAFQNTILSFTRQQGGGTIREFLRYWTMNMNSITVPNAGDVNAINVLTIHKSKGLEAPCVIIPCADWSLDVNPLDKEYLVDRTLWNKCGGNDMLTDAVKELNLCDTDQKPLEWNTNCIPPFMPISKTELRNIAVHKPQLGAIAEQEDANVLIDNINKTYVAFTRPCSELHIFAVDTPRTQGKTINALLREIIPAMTSIKVFDDNGNSTEIKGFEQHQEQQGWYQMGQQYKRTPKQEDEGPWTNCKMPPYTVSRKRVQVSLPEEASAASLLGTRIHEIMNRIHSIKDVDRVLDMSLRRGLLDQEGQWSPQSLKEAFDSIMACPDHAQWFDENNVAVYNERDMNVKGAFLRPDRIVERPDGSFIIVDYKTNDPDDNKEAAHRKQVKDYMRVLHAATGKPVKGYVWYIKSGKVLTIE